MIRTNSLLSIIFLFVFLNGCISAKKIAEWEQEEEKRMQDSTELISIHPSRPFKYGYAHTLEECEEYRRDVEKYKIKKGEVIASVGAASGWQEGIYSTMTDSVTFYIQDIDTSYLNEDQFNKMVQYYSGIRKSPQTNQFYMVIGSYRMTELPDETFDKIIINNAFHEILASGYSGSILKDLKWKLLPGGQIIVSDETSSEFKKIRHAGCEEKAEKTINLINVFSTSGFYLTGMSEPENSFENDLYFEIDKEKSDSFYARRKNVDVYLRELDKMNLKSVYKDSVAIHNIAKSIKPYVPLILSVYPSLDLYLYRIGYQLLDDGKFKEAINIMKANIYLFPQSALAYEGLGDAFYELEQFDLAKEQYQKTLSINPKLTTITAKIKEIDEK